MQRMREAITGEHPQGQGLPKLEEERMRQQGGGGAGMAGREWGRERGREGGARAGELPGLEEGGERGWERKEGGGYGYGGEGPYERGARETWAGEEETGVPAGTRGREKMPADMTDFWNDWKFGLTYSNEEWGDAFFWRAVFAEGCATTAFTYFLLSTWISLQEGGLTDIGVLRIALSAGFAYGVLNWLFHNISGGHMNPAVTLATLLNGRVTVLRALCYWGAQIVGGIVGAAMTRAMNPSSFRVLHGVTNRLNVSWRAGLLGEIMGTLLIVFTFLLAYDRRRRMDSDHVNVLAPLEIALAVTAAHLFLLPYTWAALNPARSFGSAVIGVRWTHHWIWWVAPIIAGVAGPLIYESCFKHFYSGAAERGVSAKLRKAREAEMVGEGGGYGYGSKAGVGREGAYGTERQGAGYGQERQGAGYRQTGVTTY